MTHRHTTAATLKRSAALWLLMLVAGLWAMVMAGPAWGQTPGVRFDHFKTGFPLSGAHATQRCESCHINGVFKGTPRDCHSCHTAGARLGQADVVMPPNHIPTRQTCDSCHSTSTFTGARFRHTGVIPGSCQTCHDNLHAQGKPAAHIVTRAACDTCHRTNDWSGARPDHGTFTSATFCTSCHNGGTASGKPASHVNTSEDCDSCHKTNTWSGAKVDHSKLTASQCASCHNGRAATGKPGSHIPTTANCISCHNLTGWTPTKWNHTQTTVANQCSTCHSGAYPPADGRPSNHIPYQTLTGAAITNCDSCHKSGYSAWSSGRFHANVSVVGQCATCHLTAAYGLTAKPANTMHASVTGSCETCHKTSGWAGAKVDHSRFTVATQCASCHNGSAATGKPGSHIPTTANCISCHNLTGWTPTKWNHTQTTVANQCSTCHSGAYPPADGRPSNHIPYQTLTGAAITNCDSCHKSGYSAWSPGRFHANVSVVGQCATCHLSGIYGLTSKPNNAVHSSVVSNCESCHKSSSTWTNVSFAHAISNAVGTGTCDNCHNGATATGKPSSHIPIQVGGVKCDSCHKSQVAWANNVTMNHTAMITQACKSCHISTYSGSGALAKPNNHVPESQLLSGASMDCKACHTRTTAGGFGTSAMNHNNSQGNGSGWCYACHNAGTAFLGSMERKSLTHRSRTGVTDCSQSGCHRPLGNTGATYRNWD